jgi:hypothetical protein
MHYIVAAVSSSETRNPSESVYLDKGVAGEGNLDPDAIIGRIILSRWTHEMSVKSKGVVPSKWMEDRNGVWIRKCRIANLDKALGHYELIYACGYSRSVCLTDVSRIMETHELWANSRNQDNS